MCVFPQMSVFSELLRFWPEFQELRSSVREEQLLPLLEQKRLKHRARVRRQRRKEEEEEEEERRAQVRISYTSTSVSVQSLAQKQSQPEDGAQLVSLSMMVTNNGFTEKLNEISPP